MIVIIIPSIIKGVIFIYIRSYLLYKKVIPLSIKGCTFNAKRSYLYVLTPKGETSFPPKKQLRSLSPKFSDAVISPF